jgi:hypothetical protein
VIHEQPSVVTGDVPELVLDTHRFSIQRSDVAMPEAGASIVLDPDGTAVAYTADGRSPARHGRGELELPGGTGCVVP